MSAPQKESFEKFLRSSPPEPSIFFPSDTMMIGPSAGCRTISNPCAFSLSRNPEIIPGATSTSPITWGGLSSFMEWSLCQRERQG